MGRNEWACFRSPQPSAQLLFHLLSLQSIVALERSLLLRRAVFHPNLTGSAQHPAASHLRWLVAVLLRFSHKLQPFV